MSRLTRFTTTRLRNVLRSPWAIRPSILRGGLEMAPALPQPRATIATGGQPLGRAAMHPAAADRAPALPQPRATIDTGGQPLGVAAMHPAAADPVAALPPPRPPTR